MISCFSLSIEIPYDVNGWSIIWNGSKYISHRTVCKGVYGMYVNEIISPINKSMYLDKFLPVLDKNVNIRNN